MTEMEDVKDFFSRQLQTWPEAAKRYRDLSVVQQKTFTAGSVPLAAQWNPQRMVSTGAKIDASTLQKRPCFLCGKNRPKEQAVCSIHNGYELLLNPFPILPVHFTLPKTEHTPQSIFGNYLDMMQLTERLADQMVFYNGPRCGASAPDHMHFQAGSRGIVPLERDWNALYRPRLQPLLPLSPEHVVAKAGVFSLSAYICPVFAIIAPTPVASARLFNRIYPLLPAGVNAEEPMMNILAFMQNADSIVSLIIPRRKHRPDCYFLQGEAQLMVSPGAIDMGGMLITPRETDFRRMDATLASAILQECASTFEDATAIAEKIKKAQ